jgi:L-arabinonolactonase
MNKVERIVSVGSQLGEGPLWHPREQALYWVDIEGHCFHRFHPDTGAHETFAVGQPVGCLAFRASGGLILALRDGLAFWDPQTQALQFVADPEADRPDARFNDGRVDRQGRFWAGTLGKGATSSLYRLDPDGSVYKMESGITISNGIGWSPDDRTMYFTDSPLSVIYAYDFDPASGTIENRRPFVRVPDGEGWPDGLTVDSEGCVWSAHWDGWRIVRYDPAGKVEREIPLPVQCPTSCAFGGPDLNELYITSAWTALSDAERKAQPLVGDLLRLQTDVVGQEESEFLG